LIADGVVTPAMSGLFLEFIIIKSWFI
jgi:hypothetical protein